MRRDYPFRNGDGAAVSILESTSPSTWNSLPRVSCEVAQIAQTIWEGVAKYGFQSNNQQQSESNFSFETGGGTQHITQSLSTINRYAPSGKTAPVFDGAICVDNNSVNDCVIFFFGCIKRSVFCKIIDGYKNYPAI